MPDLAETLSYGQVSDLHRSLANSSEFFANMTLPEFSAVANERTKSHKYDQGLNDNWLKRTSHNFDRLLSPISKPLGETSAAITKGVGLPQFAEQGRAIGEGLPRAMVELSTMFSGWGAAAKIPSLAKRVATGVGLMTPGATAMGAKAYTESGSPAVGVTSGVSGMLMPPMVGGAHNLASRAMANTLFKTVGDKVIPKHTGYFAGLGERAVAALARQSAAGANMELGIQSTSVAGGQGLVDPTTPEHTFDMVASMAPFAFLEVAGATATPRGKNFRSSAAQQAAMQHTAELKAKAHIRKAAEDFDKTAGDDPKVGQNTVELDRAVDEVLLAGKMEAKQAEMFTEQIKTYEDLDAGKEVKLTPENREAVDTLGDNVKIENGVAKKATEQPLLPSEQELLQQALEQFGIEGKQMAKVDVREDLAVRRQRVEALEAMEQTPEVAEQLKIARNQLAQMPGEALPAVPKTTESPDVLATRAKQADFFETPPGPIAGPGGPLARTVEQPPMRSLRQGAPQIDTKTDQVHWRRQLDSLLEPRERAEFQQPLVPFAENPYVFAVRAAKLAARIEGLIKHPAIHDNLKAKHKEILAKLKEETDLGNLNPEEVGNRLHNINMRRLAESVKQLQNVADTHIAWLEAYEAKSGKKIINKLDVVKQVNELTQQPHGQAVVDGLARILQQVEGMRNRGSGGTETVSDYAYYSLWEKAGQLANPEAWAAAKKQAATRKTMPTDVDIAEAAIAKRIKGWTEKERLEAHIDKEIRSLEGLAEEAGMPVGDLALNPLYTSDENTRLGIEVPKSEQLGDWLNKTFETALSKEEWNAAGAYEMVNKKGRQVTPSVITPLQVERSNAVMRLFRLGLIEPKRKEGDNFTLDIEGARRGKSIDESAHAALKEMGIDVPLENAYSTWVNIKNVTIRKHVVPRLQAMFLKEHYQQMKKKPGTLEQGNLEAADALDRVPLSRDQMAIGAKSWFKERFMSEGYDASIAEMYSEIAMKVALSFEDVGHGRIATLVSDTAYGEYLSKPLGKIASYIVGIGEAAEFANPVVRAAWRVMTLGHELGHAMFDPANGAMLSPRQRQWRDQAVEWATKLTPDERAVVLGQWLSAVFPKKLQTPDVTDAWVHRLGISKNEPREFLLDLAALAAMGVARPDKVTSVAHLRGELTFSAPHLQQFTKGFYLPLLDVGNAVHSYMKDVLGMPGAESYGKTVDATREVLRGTEYIDEAVTRLRAMEQYEPAQYMRLISEGRLDLPFAGDRGILDALLERDMSIKPSMKSEKMLRKAAEMLNLVDSPEVEATFGKRVGRLVGNIWPAAQAAERFPILQSPQDATFAHRSLALDMANKIAMPLMTKKTLFGQPKLDVEGTGLKYLLRNKAANDAAGAVMAIEKFRDRPLTEAEMRTQVGQVGALSEKGQQAVVDFITQKRGVALAGREVIINTGRDDIGKQVSLILSTFNKGMRGEAATALATKLSGLAEILTRPDVTPEAKQQAQIARLALEHIPGLDKGWQRALHLHETLHNFVKNTENKPHWSSEQRFERFFVVWTLGEGKDSVGGAWSGPTKQSALDYAKKNLAHIKEKNMAFYDKYDRQDATSGVSPQFLEYMQKNETAKYLKELISVFGKDDAAVAEMLENYVPLEATQTAIRGAGYERFMLERKSRPGAEHLDPVRGLFAYINGLASGLAKRHSSMDMALALREPELLEPQNVQFKKTAQDHFNSVVNPQAREWAQIKRGIFAYFLGFSRSAMMIEASQSFITVMPQWTRASGSVMASHKAWAKGGRAMIDLMLNKGTLPKDPVLTEAVKKAQRRGVLDLGIAQETADEQSLAATNLRDMIQGGPGSMNPAKWATSAFNWYTRTARWLYGNTPRANAYLAFIGAYKLANEHGIYRPGESKLTKLSGEAAYTYAERTTRATNFGGGTAARPIGMFANLGKTQGAVGAAYSLATFSFSTIAMMSRFGLDAVGRLPKPQRTAARKALGQMMFAQTALAGVLGLPFVGAALAVLEQFFPELEAHKAMEDGFRALAGDDDDLGGLISDLGMRGLPFAKAGVDLSSRMSLSQVLGVNPYDGLSAGALFGPGGSLIENAIKATQYGTAGQTARAVETLVPTPFKNMVNLYRNDGVLRDNAGRPIVEPTNGEAIAFAMGFRPARLNKFRNMQKMAQRSDKIRAQENSMFHAEQAKQLLSGNIQELRQALTNRQNTVEGYNALAGARNVVHKAVDRVMPYDFARSGVRTGATERHRLSRQAGIQPASEMQRLMTKKNLEAQIGLPGAGRPSRSELTLATLIDRFMQENPQLSRQAASDMAYLVMGRRQRRF